MVSKKISFFEEKINSFNNNIPLLPGKSKTVLKECNKLSESNVNSSNERTKGECVSKEQLCANIVADELDNNHHIIYENTQISPRDKSSETEQHKTPSIPPERKETKRSESETNAPGVDSNLPILDKISANTPVHFTELGRIPTERTEINVIEPPAPVRRKIVQKPFVPPRAKKKFFFTLINELKQRRSVDENDSNEDCEGGGQRTFNEDLSSDEEKRETASGDSSSESISYRRRPYIYSKTKNFSDDEDTTYEDSDLDDWNAEKINNIIGELIKTEENYLSGLEKVVEVYMPYVTGHAPPHLLVKVPFLFGNIEKIYKESQEFLAKLKANKESLSKIIFLFTQSSSMFNLYPEYSQNKQIADEHLEKFEDIIGKCQVSIDDRLDLRSHLISPIQRLGKYILLLTEIQKDLAEVEQPFDHVTSAINNVNEVMKKCNEFLAIDFIKHGKIDFSGQGSFVMKNDFFVEKPRKFKATLFMFEHGIIFTEEDPENTDQFKYVDKIRMKELGFEKRSEEPLVLHLKDFSRDNEKGNDKLTFILRADTADSKASWCYEIESRLWNQVKQAKVEIMQPKTIYMDVPQLTVIGK